MAMLRGRQGVTPVVAVVLLTLISVSAAGAAAVWLSNIMETQQEEASRQLETSIKITDITCQSSSVDVWLRNTGSHELDAASTDLYVYESGNLVASENKDLSGKDFTDPGGHDQATFSLSTSLSSGTFYTVELEFAGGISVTTGCLGA